MSPHGVAAQYEGGGARPESAALSGSVVEVKKSATGQELFSGQWGGKEETRRPRVVKPNHEYGMTHMRKGGMRKTQVAAVQQRWRCVRSAPQVKADSV